LIDRVRLTRECLVCQLNECCPGLDFRMAESLLTSPGSDTPTFPAIVILNLHVPDFSAGAVTELMTYARERGAPFIVIVESIGTFDVQYAAKLGLCGLFPGHGGVKLLAAAIHLVLAGGRFLPPMAHQTSQGAGEFVKQRIVEKALAEAAALDAVHELQNATSFTEREYEIIQCVRRGMQNKNIAFGLGISESTVKTHLRQIMQKLGAGNRTEVVSLLYG